MSSSSDNSDSSSEDEVKKSSDSTDSDVNSRKKRVTKSVKKTIESGGSTESDSDDDEASSSKKKKATKKKSATKRKRNFSASSHDDRVDDSLFVDAEDKARWKALSELEKEQEIFERMEARENQRAREEIAQQLKAKKEEEGKKTKKRKKMASSGSDSSRSPVRRTTKKSSDSDSDMNAEFHRPSDIHRKNKEKNAMAELKQKRKEIEKKHAKHTSLSIDAVFGAQSSGSSSSSSSSASSRSSSRSSSRDSSPTTRQSEEDKLVKKDVETLEELNRARISRYKLCKIVHAPFFGTTVIGCFVRVGMGFMNAAESKYKLWQIISVEETNKVYDVDGKRTNKGLKCKHGKQERVFRIAYVSNRDFHPSEFEEWLQVTKENGPLPTIDQLEKKEADIKKAIEHKFSNSEVDAMIAEKARFQKVPRNFAMTKADLVERKAVAQQHGDIREAEKIQEEIDELEKVADDLDKKRSLDISGIAYINHRNRTSNKNEVLSGRFKMEQSSQDDPFTRKKGGMKLVSGSKTKGDGTISSSSSFANLADQEKKDDKKVVSPTKVANIKEKRKSANMFDLHNSAANNIDFNIDLDKLINNGSRVPRDEIDGPSTIGQSSSVFGGGDGKSKGMSLADYRRRKAEATGTSSAV